MELQATSLDQTNAEYKMKASDLTTFCAVKELTFVETCVRDGIKGAWFENRKHDRQFISEQEIETEILRVYEQPIPIFHSYTS